MQPRLFSTIQNPDMSGWFRIATVICFNLSTLFLIIVGNQIPDLFETKMVEIRLFDKCFGFHMSSIQMKNKMVTKMIHFRYMWYHPSTILKPNNKNSGFYTKITPYLAIIRGWILGTIVVDVWYSDPDWK